MAESTRVEHLSGVILSWAGSWSYSQTLDLAGNSCEEQTNAPAYWACFKENEELRQ